MKGRPATPFGAPDSPRQVKLRGATRSSWWCTWLLRGAAGAAACALLLAAAHYANRQTFDAVVRYVDAHRARGSLLLVAAQVACTICMVPTAPLAVAAGALFGFSRGLALIWAACVAGETAAFALGRHLLRGAAERAAAAWPAWAALEAALREDGWKMVLLLRCCPVAPFTVLNYALGSTSLPFGHFFWPSLFGIAPGLAAFVWAGHLAQDLSLGGGGGGTAVPDAASPQARVAFAAVSGVTAVAVLVGSAVYTKRALARRLARIDSGGDAEAGGGKLARRSSGTCGGAVALSGGGDCERRALLPAHLREARPGMAQRTGSGANKAAGGGAGGTGGALPQHQQQQQQHQQQRAGALSPPMSQQPRPPDPPPGGLSSAAAPQPAPPRALPPVHPQLPHAAP